MEKVDFMKIVDFIFKNKQFYGKLTDEDKISNFYMVNHKFAKGCHKKMHLFNSKFIDKASVIDLWFDHFKKQTEIPGWYFWKSPNTNKKEKDSKIPKADRELFMKSEDLKEEDFNFLVEHYLNDVEYEIKKLKRFEK